jgi:hypothetical protein
MALKLVISDHNEEIKKPDKDNIFKICNFSHADFVGYAFDKVARNNYFSDKKEQRKRLRKREK